MYSPESIANLKRAASITISFLEPVLMSIESQLKDVLDRKTINKQQQKKYIDKTLRDMKEGFDFPVKGIDDTFSLLDSKYVIGQYQHNKELQHEHYDWLNDKLQLRTIIIALENMRDGVTPDVRFMWDDKLIVIHTVDALFDTLACMGLQSFIAPIEEQLITSHANISEEERNRTTEMIVFQGICQKMNELLIIPQITYREEQLSLDLNPGCIKLIYEIYNYLIDVSIQKMQDLLDSTPHLSVKDTQNINNIIASYQAIKDQLHNEQKKQLQHGAVISKLLGPIVHLASSLDGAARYGTPVQFFGTTYENAEEMYELCKALVKKYDFGQGNRDTLNTIRKYLLSYKS